MTIETELGTAALPERDAKLIGANQKLRFFPLSIASASGSEVTDHTGRTLLDLSAAWGANGVGHRIRWWWRPCRKLRLLAGVRVCSQR